MGPSGDFGHMGVAVSGGRAVFPAPELPRSFEAKEAKSHLWGLGGDGAACTRTPGSIPGGSDIPPSHHPPIRAKVYFTLTVLVKCSWRLQGECGHCGGGTSTHSSAGLCREMSAS